MSFTSLIFVLLILAVIGVLVWLAKSLLKEEGDSTSGIRTLVSNQRAELDRGNKPKTSLYDVTQNSTAKRKPSSSVLTLEKRLKYAQWKIGKRNYYFAQVAISILAFFTLGRCFGIVLQVATLLIGPLLMSALLNRAVNARFKAFDVDYAPFLLSLVGLLKTGMNSMGAIDAAAEGLEDGSLLKLECQLMLERLRVGVPEEVSIGAFAEDVNHPEIELFVQALLLSRRVGGALSDTLDRLARQVRKRQYFRKQAIAAVGMQRGSIWFIVAIMTFVMGYLYLMYPESIVGAIHDENGWMVYQFGFFVILSGIYWVRKVTNIKV